MSFAPIFPDPSADQTDTLQSYINDNPEMYLRAGVYCHHGLTLPTNFVLRGQGDATALNQIDGTVGVTLNNVQNVVVERIRLQTASPIPTVAALIQDSQLVTLRNVSIGGRDGVSYFSEAGLKFVSTAGNNYGHAIEACRIQACRGDGIKIIGGIGASHFLGGHIQGNQGYGFNAPAPHGVECSLRSVIVEGNTGGQVYVDNWYNSEVAGCHFENSAGQSSRIMRLGLAGACKALSIHNSGFAGVLTDYLIDLNGAGANVGIAIRNNTFANASLAALFVFSLWRSEVVGNAIDTPNLPLIAYRDSGAPNNNLILQDAETFGAISTGAQPKVTNITGQ